LRWQRKQRLAQQAPQPLGGTRRVRRAKARAATAKSDAVDEAVTSVAQGAIRDSTQASTAAAQAITTAFSAGFTTCVLGIRDALENDEATGDGLLGDKKPECGFSRQQHCQRRIQGHRPEPHQVDKPGRNSHLAHRRSSSDSAQPLDERRRRENIFDLWRRSSRFIGRLLQAGTRSCRLVAMHQSSFLRTGPSEVDT